MKLSFFLSFILLIIGVSFLGCTQTEKDQIDDDIMLIKKAARAELTSNYDESIEYYQAILKNYPESPQCDKALFMIGFIKTEYLDQKEEALDYFKEMLEKYPKSDLTDDAQFMIETIESGKDALDKFKNDTSQ